LTKANKYWLPLQLRISGETNSKHFTRVLMTISRMSIDIIGPVDKEFKNVQAKFVNMNSIDRTLKIVFEPLMELTCPL
jgi:hypothetical protein